MGKIVRQQPSTIQRRIEWRMAVHQIACMDSYFKFIQQTSEENGIEGAVLTFADITKTRNLQEALRQNEERLRVALNSSSIAVFNQDARLRTAWIHNPSPGFKAEEIIGKTDTDFLPEQEAARLTAIKRQALGGGKGARQKVRTTMAGNTREYDLTLEPLRDAAGAVVGLTCASLEASGQQGGECPGASHREKEES